MLTDKLIDIIKTGMDSNADKDLLGGGLDSDLDRKAKGSGILWGVLSVIIILFTLIWPELPKV